MPLGRPAYVIPRDDILSLKMETSVEIIRVEDAIIRCEDFIGEVFEESISAVDVKQLVNIEVLNSMMEPSPSKDDFALAKGFAEFRAIGLVLIALAATLAFSEAKWLMSLGIFLGGLLIVGVLGREVAQSLRSDLAPERIVGCTTRQLMIVAAITVLPPTVTGTAISVGVHQGNSLLSLAAGASYALALSMAILLGGLAVVRIQVTRR
ncbi:MAG: hypothetical protein WA580_05165 [Acidimicrobiales bacterium]